MTYAKRVDVNQKEIVKTLRDFGASVVDLSKVGHGVPDLLVGYAGLTILVEVKSSEKATFTDAQLEFMKIANYLNFLSYSYIIILIFFSLSLGIFSSFLCLRRLNHGWLAAEKSGRGY